jgi:hypothetical protein
MRHDGFFADQKTLSAVSPQPNSDYDPNPLDIPCNILTGALHSKTLWVQFMDGSTWGEIDAQAYMMAQRTNALDFLNELKAAYANGGQAAFQKALSGFTYHVGSKWDDLRRDEARTTQLRLEQMADITSQLVEVNRMLSVASTRTAWLK